MYRGSLGHSDGSLCFKNATINLNVQPHISKVICTVKPVYNGHAI